VPGAAYAEALELGRRAAEQHLRSGHIDEGLGVLHLVLGALDMRLAPTPRRALFSLLLRRAHLRLRGLGFQERDTSRISPEELTRIDVCWSVAAGLSVVDTIRGADFQTRNLLVSLRAGEPYRIARALAMEGGFQATAGGPGRARTARVLALAESIAQRIGHPHALGMTAMSAGIAAYLEGRWRAAHEGCERAYEVFRNRCTGVAWEAATAQLFSLWSLFYLGETGLLARRAAALTALADGVGDLFAATSIRAGPAAMAWLAAGDPESALRTSDEAMRSWSHTGYHIQHAYYSYSRVQVDLYRGDGRAALARVRAVWPEIESALVLRIQHLRVVWLYLRARCALAAAEGAGAEGERALIGEAAAGARRIERERMPWSDPFARLVRAGIAARGGRREEAAAHFAAAAAGFDAVEMGLYAAAARRRHGEHAGGDEGRALVAAADAWMAPRDVKDPARVTAMLAPGAPVRE
jgi:hypothetical protein